MCQPLHDLIKIKKIEITLDTGVKDLHNFMLLSLTAAV